MKKRFIAILVPIVIIFSLFMFNALAGSVSHIKVLNDKLFFGDTLKASIDTGGLSKDYFVALYDTSSAKIGTKTKIADLKDGLFTAVIPENGFHEIRIYKSDLKTVIEKYELIVYNYEPVIELPKKAYGPGETIKISYTGAPSYNDAWIGLFKLDANDEKLVTKSVLQGGKGLFEVKAPSEIGLYRIRIFEHASLYSSVGMTVEFYVTTYNNIKVEIDKENVNPCEEMTVKFSGIPDGIPVSIKIGQYEEFLRNKTQGELKVVAPPGKGNYSATVYINRNPNTVVYESELFTVSKSLEDKTLDDNLYVITRQYFTNFGNFLLGRKGNRVEGYYDHNNGIISGTVEMTDYEYKVTGTFREKSEKTGDEYIGDIVLYISGDGEIVTGGWKFKGNNIWQPINGGWPNGDVYGLKNIHINSWTDKLVLLWEEDFQDGLMGYNVYRKDESGKWDTKPLNQNPLKELQYVDTKVQAGRKYTYKVKGVFGNGVEKDVAKETGIFCGKVISFNPNGYGIVYDSCYIQNTFIQKEKLFIFPGQPHIVNNTSVVPARFFAESVGAKVSWDSKKKETIISKDGVVIKIQSNNSAININGKPVKLAVAPRIEYGVLYVPLRSIFSELGCKIYWDVTNQTANVLF